MKRRGHSAIVMLALALAPLTPSLPADAAVFSCDGFAPSETSCSTGTRTRVGAISHDVAADINYAGTIESTLTWSGGVRVFRCTYTQALRRGCIGSGKFPPENASFTHRCRSIVPGTVVSPAPGVDLNGIEGGVGTWQCSVTV